jgi:hypothetical protein
MLAQVSSPGKRAYTSFYEYKLLSYPAVTTM